MNQNEIIQAIKQGQNPQQITMQILQNRMGSTPLGQNLLNLARDNKSAEIEQIVRNIAKQRGIDYDKEFALFKQMLGM